MQKIILPLVLVALLALPFGKAQSQHQPKTLVFMHVTVIDATGASPKPDLTVMITDNRITVIGRTTGVSIPKNARVIDAAGKFLIPGLWDMHVHWYGHDKAYLGLFIANGVTGVRIMWGAPVHFEWRKQIEERTLLGPRIVISSTIVDGPKPAWPDSIGVSNETEGRQAVTKARKDGADFVKVYALLPREAYFAIADEAKKQGLPFAGHVPYSVSAGEASDAGQRSIEHLTGILEACSTKEQEWRKGMLEAFSNLPQGQRVASPARTRPLTRVLLENFSPEKATALFARLRRNHIWQCPTLTLLRSAAFINDPAFRNDDRLKYMPVSMRAQWDPTTDFRFKENTAEDFDLARLVYKKQVELAGMMHQAGVPFLAGSDVQNPYCFPGFSLHDELALLVNAGFTPMEALQAATRNPARFLGKEKELGTVEKGKIADLMLLEANPLEDIRNTTKINSVVVNGRLLDRKTLDRLLAELEAAAKK
jgi:imidazolonepropionase-like amidohydrolase